MSDSAGFDEPTAVTPINIDHVVFDQVPQTILEATTYSARWGYLAKTDIDLPTLATWDGTLRRDRRVLVPIDVQALVSVGDGAQVTPVGGVLDDPAPFADLTSLPTGVHLHWALPDTLLSGSLDDEDDDAPPRFPALPDRWVVVRTIAPAGSRTVLHRGWVIDAETGGVASLESYRGGSIPGDLEHLPGLDATARRSLLWSGTYAGAQGRFTFRDDLSDIAADRPAPAAVTRACYLVAGWYSAPSTDPLHGAGGVRTLESALASVSWTVSRDGPDSDEDDVDPAVKRSRARSGTPSPVGGTVETITADGASIMRYDGVAPSGAIQLQDVARTILGSASTRYHSLLHGCVLGVPIGGRADGVDRRPSAGQVTGSIGLDLDDVAAALASASLTDSGSSPSTQNRQRSERLMAAFTSGLLARIGTPDGLADIDEHEHRDTFSSVPGPPLPLAKPDRVRGEDSLPTNPLTVGRKGRGAEQSVPATRITFSKTQRGLHEKYLQHSDADDAASPLTSRGRKSGTSTSARRTRTPGGESALPAARELIRAAPRIFRPAPPMIGLRGARPHPRHHHDGSHDDSGRLVCRREGEVVTALVGVVEGRQVLPSLGSGAIPPEVLPLAREMVLLNGYDAAWLAAAGQERVPDHRAVATRVAGEMLRLYGDRASYDATGVSALAGSQVSPVQPRARVSDWQIRQEVKDPILVQLAASVSRHSLVEGTMPSPVALTTWVQPWCPVFLEWEIQIEGRDDLAGWELAELDLTWTGDDSGGADSSVPAPTMTRVIRGRAPVGSGVSATLTASIRSWLEDEDKRDTQPGASQLSTADERALADLADYLAPLEVISASLDGIREQLLGIGYEGFVVRERDGDGEPALPEATQAPVPLFAGTVTVSALRLVDTFGRTLDLRTDALTTTTSLEVAGSPSTMRLRPRLQHGARWLFRLVDPAYPLGADPAAAPEAFVDQVSPELAVNPVSGFLLPDHIDEACEVFDRDGSPLGQLGHDPITGAVTWQPAPGLPLPPSAGPMDPSTPDHAQHAARIADGVVAADIAYRESAASDGLGRGAPAEQRSALSALLGAIDSTLWTVDTYAALGSPSIAGLVGRPLAVVRATLRLEAPDDLGEVRITAPGGGPERLAAFQTLRRHRFGVRIGDLVRSDDATLGFFVDDDYSRFHVVDRVVAEVTRESRRQHGQLGLLGATVTPDITPLDHPYIDPEDTLLVSVGQVVRLTILMVPGGRVHLTSGIAPRKALALADGWTSAGLRRMSPSMRVGPVLVDPAEIHLPKVASLGDDQVFTRRTGPLTWRDDPIVAATTAAHLPRMAHEAQEGWIRVTPVDEQTSGGG